MFIQFTVLLIVPYIIHIVLCNWTLHINHCKYYYLYMVAHFKLKIKCFIYFPCCIIDSLIYYLLYNHLRTV